MRHGETGELDVWVPHWFAPGGLSGGGNSQNDAALIAEAFKGLFSKYQVPVTIIVTLRALDLITWCAIACAIQGAVSRDGLIQQPGVEEGSGMDTKLAFRLHPGIEPLAKTWERIRKAMKELEETCAAAGAPVSKGLADTMRPILEKAEGVLEDALALKAKRARTAGPSIQREDPPAQPAVESEPEAECEHGVE